MKPTIFLQFFHALYAFTRLLALLTIFSNATLAQGTVKLATFDVDATPPLGSAMAYDPVNRLDESKGTCVQRCSVWWNALRRSKTHESNELVCIRCKRFWCCRYASIQ